MDCDMRTDAELLVELTDAAPTVRDRITGHIVVASAKQVAAWTGRSVQTVSDYRSGKTNIPIDFWRALLGRCMDSAVNSRILRLLAPDNAVLEFLPLEPVPAATPRDVFAQMLDAESAHHEKQRYLLEILADNRVDELDREAVQQFVDAFDAHRQRDALIYRTVIERYNQTLTPQRSRP
jgi:hypothetical protein